MAGFQNNYEFACNDNASDEWNKQEEIYDLQDELRKRNEYFSSFQSDMFQEVGELQLEIKKLKESSVSKNCMPSDDCGQSPGFVSSRVYDERPQRALPEPRYTGNDRDQTSSTPVSRSGNNGPLGHGERPRREVQPEKFDGKKSWANYKIHFDACKNLNRWSDQEACTWLATCLTGDAVQALGHDWSPGQFRYGELMSRLDKSFGPCVSAENYIIEFRSRKRRQGESLQDLSQALRQLVSRAYPDMDRDAHDKLARDQFKDALDDGELRSAIFRSRPQKLEESVTAAIEMECFLKAEKSRGGRSSTGKPMPVYTRNVESNPNENERMKEMETKIDRLTSLLKGMQVNMNSSTVKPNQNSHGYYAKQAIQCHYCHQEGHMKGQCKLYEQEDPQGFQRLIDYLKNKSSGNGRRSSQRAMERPQRQSPAPIGQPPQVVPEIQVTQHQD